MKHTDEAPLGAQLKKGNNQMTNETDGPDNEKTPRDGTVCGAAHAVAGDESAQCEAPAQPIAKEAE